MEPSVSLSKVASKDTSNHSSNDIFDNANVAIWLINANSLRQDLVKHFKNKKRNIVSLLSRCPELIDTFIKKLEVTDVNNYAQKLYAVDTKSQLSRTAKKLFTGVEYSVIADFLNAILSGADEFSFNSSKYAFNGSKIITSVNVKIPRAYLGTWDEWVVTEIERTETVTEKNDYQFELEKIKEQQQIQKKIISIISHDLQSPFNNIIGFSDIMLDRFDDYPKEKILLFLKHINDTASQSYNLLNNLLNWAKLTRENYEVKKNVFNVSNNTDEVLSFFKTEFDTKNIKVFNLTPPQLEINSDVDSFQFVLRNLLSNAIKFSNRNSRIVITANVDEGYTNIHVADEGVGMDESTRLKILESEELYSCAGTCKEKGNGLGLKLCNEFMKRAGALFDIQSEIDKGTTFTISFPN